MDNAGAKNTNMEGHAQRYLSGVKTLVNDQGDANELDGKARQNY